MKKLVLIAILGAFAATHVLAGDCSECPSNKPTDTDKEKTEKKEETKEQS